MYAAGSGEEVQRRDATFINGLLDGGSHPLR